VDLFKASLELDFHTLETHLTLLTASRFSAVLARADRLATLAP